LPLAVFHQRQWCWVARCICCSNKKGVSSEHGCHKMTSFLIIRSPYICDDVVKANMMVLLNAYDCFGQMCSESNWFCVRCRMNKRWWCIWKKNIQCNNNCVVYMNCFHGSMLQKQNFILEWVRSCCQW
jgi:hypothetical protein